MHRFPIRVYYEDTDMAGMLSPSGALSVSRVDITLSDGRRVLIEGPTALTAIISLVQGLAV